MKDISKLLWETMRKEKCSSLGALLLIKKEPVSDVRILQSKSTKQTGGRLRNKGNI